MFISEFRKEIKTKNIQTLLDGVVPNNSRWFVRDEIDGATASPQNKQKTIRNYKGNMLTVHYPLAHGP